MVYFVIFMHHEFNFIKNLIIFLCQDLSFSIQFQFWKFPSNFMLKFHALANLFPRFLTWAAFANTGGYKVLK